MWLGVRIVNRRERWAKRTAVMLAVALVVVGAYAAAYHAMLKPRMVMTSLTDGHRMTKVSDGESFHASFERAYCWGSLQDPATPESAWRAFFGPAAKIDRLLGLHPSLDE
jgi:hypothetical protein